MCRIVAAKNDVQMRVSKNTLFVALLLFFFLQRRPLVTIHTPLATATNSHVVRVSLLLKLKLMTKLIPSLAEPDTMISMALVFSGGKESISF